VKAYLKRIADGEKVEVTEDGLSSIAVLAAGDLRKATNILQVSASMGGRVDADAVFESTENIRPSEIQEMLTTALGGNFTAARSRLDELIARHGLSGEDIVAGIHRAVFDLPVSEDAKIGLIDRVGEAEFRMVSGASERIQLEALLAHFAHEGRKLK
jgi:replication factor C small subunit